MVTRNLVDQLRTLSNAERLGVIEIASRLIREDLGQTDGHLTAAAQSVRDLYEPGGELSEWTGLDAEPIVEGYA